MVLPTTRGDREGNYTDVTEREIESLLWRLTLDMMLVLYFPLIFFFFFASFLICPALGCKLEFQHLFGRSLPSEACAGLCHSRETKSTFETADEDSAELPVKIVNSAASL